MKREASIAIPCAQVVDPRTLQSMLALVAYSVKHGVDIHHVGITERALIDDARNTLTETFLKSNTEWMFWMDSDMTFAPNTLTRLFEVAEEKDAKLVTGVYYQRKGMNYPVIWSRGEETEGGEVTGLRAQKGKENKYLGSFAIPHPDKKQPFEVHAAGFGCILVHRSVLEMMDRPWFKFIHGTCSEDFYFCVQAKELGFKLWAAPDIELGHIGDAPIITKQNFIRNASEKNILIDPLKGK